MPLSLIFLLLGTAFMAGGSEPTAETSQIEMARV